MIAQRRHALAMDLPHLEHDPLCVDPLVSPSAFLTPGVRFFSRHDCSGMQVRHPRRRRMLSGHCQHLFDAPPHHALAGLHRNCLTRSQDHEHLLHPISPLCSRLLGGTCMLLATRSSVVHPHHRAGSHPPRLPSVTWFHRSPPGLWLGQGGKLFTQCSEGSIGSLV